MIASGCLNPLEIELQRSMTETQARERAERRRELIAKGKIDEVL
jgi:hypothetical protein